MDGTRSYHYEARSIAFTCRLFIVAHRSPSNCGSMPISTFVLAAHRFWLALEGAFLVLPIFDLPRQRRQRFIWPSVPSTDGWREMAIEKLPKACLAGEKPGRSWKATIFAAGRSACQDGISLMRGGYRALLRPQYRKK